MEANAAKRAIVFGGSGFLGSHVADELTSRGYEVSIFDISPSSFLGAKQRFIQGDILDREAVQRAVQGADYVYNFAGLADINAAKENPLLTAQLNIMGHIHILEAAQAAQVERMIFASTVYVYGDSGSFYCASKQAAERFVELYREKYGLPFSILRYGSLYGRRADQRNAIFRFVKEALETGRVHYNGTGDEIREYVHVIDAAIASVDVLASRFENQHIVITGNQQYRVHDVMLMIAEMLAHKKVELVFANADIEAHYNITPYAYRPRPGKKLVVNPFVDMGQGILDCIHEIDALSATPLAQIQSSEAFGEL